MEIFWLNLPNSWMEWDYSWYSAGRSELLCCSDDVVFYASTVVLSVVFLALMGCDHFSNAVHLSTHFPFCRVLWCCWLGGRKSIRPVKDWVMRCWRGYLSRVRCKWFAYGPADPIVSCWYHSHPVISCFIKMWIGLTFLVPAYQACPGKEVVKWVSVMLCIYFLL